MRLPILWALCVWGMVGNAAPPDPSMVGKRLVGPPHHNMAVAVSFDVSKALTASQDVSDLEEANLEGDLTTISLRDSEGAVPGYTASTVSAVNGDKLSFLAVGDWGRDGIAAQVAVANRMKTVANKVNANFVASAGNNFLPHGLPSSNHSKVVSSWSSVYGGMDKDWYVCLGNHDLEGSAEAQVDMKKTNPKWHLDKRRFYALEKKMPNQDCFATPDDLLLLIFLDTTPFIQKYWASGMNDTTTHKHHRMQASLKSAEEASVQLQWLDTTLMNYNALNSVRWKVVVGHHPIVSNGPTGEITELQKKIQPILEHRKVHMYINGHDHNLQHHTKNGVEYVTTGAGSSLNKTIATLGSTVFSEDSKMGFASVSANRTHMKTQLIDADGELLHEFSVKHPVGPMETDRCTVLMPL